MPLHLFCLFSPINKAPAGARSDWDIKINYAAAKISRTDPWVNWNVSARKVAKTHLDISKAEPLGFFFFFFARQVVLHSHDPSPWSALPVDEGTAINSRNRMLFACDLGRIKTAGFTVINETMFMLNRSIWYLRYNALVWESSYMLHTWSLLSESCEVKIFHVIRTYSVLTQHSNFLPDCQFSTNTSTGNQTLTLAGK